ncbi:MAG: uridylate kinase [Candidatus Paraimprobicoccus trichonymphae]|uniref:Uridylate kinase n=1 Tax=Candidatus Paraimprobicoccus trichonymphae TaxID=3033793 RepID=A0AA48I2J5_9FIRM|nr:MAG: uridylate kinase [Candidatus Paraimprobicoccus trichonymphae]
MGIDFNIVSDISKIIKKCFDMGVQIGLVIGGGNFWRGRSNLNIDRVRADHIGMASTVINSLVILDFLEKLNLKAKVLSAIEMKQISEFYTRDKAVWYLENNSIVIFSFGTGIPFFSTDTAAALRASEIQADIFLKATNIDGVYDKDPGELDAKKYSEISFDELISKNLKVIDIPAASICRDNNIPILIFDIKNLDNICQAVNGSTQVGTILKLRTK